MDRKQFYGYDSQEHYDQSERGCNMIIKWIWVIILLCIAVLMYGESKLLALFGVL